MKTIRDIIKSLDAIEIYNGEVLYSFAEFYEVLKSICEEYLSTDDCIMTPYYMLGKKRMELYAYELNIQLVETLDFEKYLLRKTGKRKLEEIPEEVILLQKNCYYEVLQSEHKISVQKIRQYIDFLYQNHCFKSQIEKTFGKFEKENLFFDFY